MKGGQLRVTEPTDRLLRVSEAGTLLGLSDGSVRHWLRMGYLREIKLPSGQRRISQSQVESIIRGKK